MSVREPIEYQNESREVYVIAGNLPGENTVFEDERLRRCNDWDTGFVTLCAIADTVSIANINVFYVHVNIIYYILQHISKF